MSLATKSKEYTQSLEKALKKQERFLFDVNAFLVNLMAKTILNKSINKDDLEDLMAKYLGGKNV